MTLSRIERVAHDLLVSAARWPVVFAVLAGAVALTFGLSVESAVIHLVHGVRAKLEWISDVVVSIGIAALVDLGLHLFRSRARVIALERAQGALDGQLRLAAEIQRSLLPEIPPATPGFRWAARMHPAGYVGGDFYDFYQPRPDTVLAILGDVSGKGVPAALLLSSVSTLFRVITRDTSDPAAIARRLSTALFEEHAGVPYVTAIVARFDNVPRRMTYVNAGHPSAYLLRDGATSSLPSLGPPLGLLAGSRFAAAEEELRPGDLGVLVTDGVTEALETGRTRLDDALRRLNDHQRAGRSLPQICDEVLQIAADGGGPAGYKGWQDDRTVLVFAVEAGS